MAASVGPTAGVVSGNAAAPGQVGEVIDGSAALDSVSLTTSTAANLCSITLTPGDWELFGVAHFIAPGGGTSVTLLEASCSPTSAGRLIGPSYYGQIAIPFTATATGRVSVFPPVRQVNVAASQTIYLVAFALFTGSTLAAGGSIHARRVR